MAHLKKTIYQKTKNLDMFYSYKNFVTPMRKLRKWLAANVNNNEKTLFNSNIIFTEIIKALKCRSSLQFVNTEDCHE